MSSKQDHGKTSAMKSTVAIAYLAVSSGFINYLEARDFFIKQNSEIFSIPPAQIENLTAHELEFIERRD